MANIVFTRFAMRLKSQEEHFTITCLEVKKKMRGMQSGELNCDKEYKNCSMSTGKSLVQEKLPLCLKSKG